MPINPFYERILDTACERARVGQTSTPIHDDTEVEVLIDPAGRVCVQLNGNARTEIRAWAEATVPWAENRMVSTDTRTHTLRFRPF